MPSTLSNRYKAVLMGVGACMKGGAAFCWLLTIALIFGSIIHVQTKVGLLAWVIRCFICCKYPSASLCPPRGNVKCHLLFWLILKEKRKNEKKKKTVIFVVGL